MVIFFLLLSLFLHGISLVHGSRKKLENQLLRDDLNKSREDEQRLTAIVDGEREKFHALDCEFVGFRAREAERLRALEEKLSFVGNARAEMEKSFKVAAAEISEKALLQLQRESREEGERERLQLEGVLKPVRECVERLDARVNLTDRQRMESTTRFEEQMRQLFQSNQELDREAKRLNAALRLSHVRGRWGELQLRRLVEMAGLQEHVDFEEQVAVSVDQATLRADMVVHLPDGRNVIIDAKAVLEVHLAVAEAETPEQREALLKQHAQNVFNRVQELGRKGYWKFFESTFEYMILFLPGDHLYAAAINARPELFDEAIERHVLLASPMTLLAFLKTIACGWAQAATAKEATAIVELGKTLLERMETVFGKISDTGRHLRRTLDAYNSTVASIESRLRPTLHAFTRMRSLPQKPMPVLEAIEEPIRSLRTAIDEGTEATTFPPTPTAMNLSDGR
ncbi:MAG: DNA recombination protein RmuC [Puniceicoccales bacterium]|jgi:DNA recombination protein RmuC|nr:DNA recombination protein RmuC [Puniceicoccales bacterium]